jgi:type IV secretion system protein VirD4
MRQARAAQRPARPHAGAVALIGAGALAAEQLLASIGLDPAPIGTIGLAGALTAIGGASVLGHRLTPRGQFRTRYGQGGWVTSRQLRRVLGRNATREAALGVRPSLAALTRVERRKLPASEFGVRIGRTVTGPVVPRSVHFSYEDVCLVVAPPRTGKTGLLGNWIVDHPGPVVATSTKTDTHEHTVGLRQQRGHVWVFNPENLGGLASTFRWSPVAGCDEPAIAQERAGYLVSGGSEGGRDSRFWEDQSVAVLRAYLMAAAIDNRSMAEVASWISDPTDPTAIRILEKYPQVVPSAWIDSLDQVQSDSCAANTRNSIYITLRLAVAFMGDPSVARCCLPEPDEAVFDVKEFIESTSTLYLIGSERKHTAIAPLLTALTGHVFEESKRLAAHKPKGRHDPPLLFALDEAALIVPVPLDRWTSDAGGRGITLVIAVQSPSQLVARWGHEGAATIRNSATVKVYFGGLTEHRDLEAICAVSGEREEDAVTIDLAGVMRTPRSVTQRQVRTITPDRLRELPPRHVLVLYRSARPVIARIRHVWDRADVRAAKLPADHVGEAE